MTFFLLPSSIFPQTSLNPSPAKTLINENPSVVTRHASPVTHHYFITFSQSLYLNTNLPNLENQNGNYFPKGYGVFSSLLLQYRSSHFTLTAEPRIFDRKQYEISIPHKENEFSVLNDVPLLDIYKRNRFRNTGLKLHFYGISAGLGNWDQWWGPGIHNSLSLSNNAQGFYHYYIGTDGNQSVGEYVDFSFKYFVSRPMQNLKGDDYFVSSWFLKAKYKFLELGLNRNVVSGGYPDLPWEQQDVLTVLIDQNNIKYWDTINTYYILANFEESGLKVFLEIGFPNRSYAGQDPEVYSDHAMASNLGLRKQGAFGSENLLFGFEYTRLVQGIYYNILPTPNWYDNIKYNYSSYKGRRWAAHSGSDSDDFLIFVGYKDERKSFIYGLNYERHGVTYHFPPEVKFESRINASYKRGNTQIHIIYENEYFEHYGFVDVNRNVWDETFEPGSLQRTHTLLISLEHTLSF